MQITQLQNPTKAQTAELACLLAQLTTDAPQLEVVTQILQQPGVYMFIATNDEQHILGTATLATYTLLSGTKAWIEDVVVDSSARKQGIGQQLVLHILKFARQKGINKIDLSSRPERIAANKLYQKLGFEQRKTNIYRNEQNIIIK